MSHVDLPNLTVVNHPLIQHKLTILRDKRTGTRDFKQLVSEIAMLMAYDVTKDLRLEPVKIETPLERMRGAQVAGKKLTLVPILRAGLGMVEGISHLIPSARIGHIGLYRDAETLRPVSYFERLPVNIAAAEVLLLDPMLATGHSACEAASMLRAQGAQRVQFLCVIACPAGVQQLQSEHPDVAIVTAAIDPKLNDRGYIVPGLGDAGDRYFGTG